LPDGSFTIDGHSQQTNASNASNASQLFIIGTKVVDFRSVAYDRFVPVLINSIKDLKAELQSVKKVIAAAAAAAAAMDKCSSIP
jgi:hypothetical protein